MTASLHYTQIAKAVALKAAACGRKAEEITLIIVSKNHSVQSIEAVYEEGGRDFGESRVQEALKKISELPGDIRWHLIGSLQSNKIKKALSTFCLIHSVDTPSLAQKISQAAIECGMPASILLQVNTSGEKTKHGACAEEWQSSLELINQLPLVNIEGLMTIAPNGPQEGEIRACFRQLYCLREQWRPQMRFPEKFRHLSMGMSNDYLIAIEEGATMLRIGTAIFGTIP